MSRKEATYKQVAKRWYVDTRKVEFLSFARLVKQLNLNFSAGQSTFLEKIKIGGTSSLQVASSSATEHICIESIEMIALLRPSQLLLQ